MQLVLDHEVGRRQGTVEPPARSRLRRPVEARRVPRRPFCRASRRTAPCRAASRRAASRRAASRRTASRRTASRRTASRRPSRRIEAFGAAEQLAGLRHPGERRELVHRRDQEGGQAAVDGLVHGQDRERPVSAEVAFEVRADDAQLDRPLVVRQQREGGGLEAGPAPGAALERDRGGLATGIRLELPGPGARRIRAPVALAAHEVGCRRLADPQPDLEGPCAVARIGGGLAFQLQRADQAGRAGELVQGEQAQRVPHDDAHAGSLEPVVFRVAQPAQHHREGREAEVRLRLAAAGGEEEQVHGLAVGVVRVGEAGNV